MKEAVEAGGRESGLSLRLLARESGQYGLAEALTKGGWLLGIPIFARLLSPAEFGLVELVTSLGWILLPIIVLSQDFSVQGYAMNTSPGRGNVVAAALLLAGTSALVWLVIGQVLAPWFRTALVPGLPSGPALNFGLAWICVNAYLRLLRFPLRLAFQVGTYFQVSLIGTAGGLALALAFVATGLLPPLEAYFAGLLLSGVAGVLLAGAKLWRRWAAPVDASGMRRAAALGTAFVPIVLLDALTLNVDRLLVSRWLDLHATGVYGLAQKAAQLVEFPLIMFSLAWVPRATAAYHQCSEEYGRYYRRTLGPVLILFGGLAAATTLLAPEIIALLGTPDYRRASDAVGPLSVLVVGMALARVCSVVVVARRKPATAFALAGLALLVTLTLAFLLVPYWGFVGAAVAAAAGQWVLGGGYYLAVAGLIAAERRDHSVVLAAVAICGSLAALGPTAAVWSLQARTAVLLVTVGVMAGMALAWTDLRLAVLAHLRARLPER